MSIRHLDDLLEPRSVAVIGASDRPGRVGTTVWRNLHGHFPGPCRAVNPRLQSLDGEAVAPDVASLPEAPMLAVICTPPATVPGLIDELGARGTRAAVVMTAGLTDEQKTAMLQAARRHLLRILGPNCLGLLAPHAGLNASFAHVPAEKGALAFVSQSGALVTAMLDWARGRGIGFSVFASLGEHADVDFGDMLDWLATDPRTRAILLYIESIESPRKFMSAARAAARNKPVVVVKAGRTAAGAQAAASHTGALAASDLVFDAAIRRAGMLRVDTLQDLFLAAETLGHVRDPSVPTAPTELGELERLTLLTNGGGAGVLAADAAAAAGIELATLRPETLAALDAVLPANWSRGNPVDIIGDAPVERYQAALQQVLADPGLGTVLFMHAPTALVSADEIARAVLPLLKAAAPRVLTCWIGDTAVAEARRLCRAEGLPAFETPEAAVRAFSMRVTYRRNQAQLMEAPPVREMPAPDSPAVPAVPAVPVAPGLAAAPPLTVPAPVPDTARVREVIDAALAQGRQMLTEPEAKALLAACGVPVVRTEVCDPTPDAAARAAAGIGYPVALKILSPQISHKSDVGGVALDLEDETALRAAATAMLDRVRRAAPDARHQGFTVQAMVRRPRALELIVGASIDPLFGPVILFGQGGTAVEVLADRAIGLPPLNVPLARALVARTRVARLMAGWRDVPPVDQAAVHGVLVAVSQLLAEEPRIAELDLNPLLADAQGVVALDARVRVDAAGPGGAERFAIRPYPSELVETQAWQDRTLVIRPIRPEDGPQHRAFLKQLDPIDIRLRVFYSRREFSDSELARATQVDYERELAFVATTTGPDGAEETLGVVRAAIDPDNADAEFGIIVRSDLKGSGLGERLMRKLIDVLRARGTQRLVAHVLRENTRMLELARELGFTLAPPRWGDDTRFVELALQGPATAGEQGLQAQGMPLM